MRVLTIIKDDRITGVQYGILDVSKKELNIDREKKVAKKYTQGTIRSRIKSIIELQKHK